MSAAGTESWASNTTIAEAASFLRAAKRVVVLTHSKADGDALGSTLALARTLGRVGVEATPWYFGALPHWGKLAIADTTVELGAEGRHPPNDAEAVVVLDTGAWEQLFEVRAWLEGRAEQTIVIDHHLRGDADVASRRIVETHASAVCELVTPLCVELLGVDGPEHLPVDIAEPLYLGLATDTGWFRYSNVTAASMRLAAALLDAGIDQPKVYRTVELCERPARLRLMAAALNSLELHDQDRVAIMMIRQSDMREAKAAPGDAGGFADLALAVASVRVGVVLFETPKKNGQTPLTRISMRSKALDDDSVDVNEVAQRLGGGGHARAAGARAQGTVDEVKARVLEALT